MKVEIGTLVDSYKALQELADISLPAATSMQVALLLSEAAQPMKAFQDAYNRLLQEVGVPKEGEPGKYDIKDQKRYSQEVEELIKQEVTFSLDDKLSNLGSACVKPATLLALNWLIKV
jgi:hypothetical protein